MLYINAEWYRKKNYGLLGEYSRRSYFQCWKCFLYAFDRNSSTRRCLKAFGKRFLGYSFANLLRDFWFVKNLMGNVVMKKTNGIRFDCKISGWIVFVSFQIYCAYFSLIQWQTAWIFSEFFIDHCCFFSRKLFGLHKENKDDLQWSDTIEDKLQITTQQLSFFADLVLWWTSELLHFEAFYPLAN